MHLKIPEIPASIHDAVPFVDRKRGTCLIGEIEGRIWICRVVNERWMTDREATLDDVDQLLKMSIEYYKHPLVNHATALKGDRGSHVE